MSTATARAPAKDAGSKQPAMTRPEQAKLDKDVAALEAEIAAYEREAESYEAEIAARIAATSVNRAVAAEARALFNELRAAQDAVKREKDAIFTQIAALKAAPGSSKPGDKAGAPADRPKFRTEAEVDEAIDALIERQSTETMSLTEEKALVKKISDLRLVKTGFRAAAAAEEEAKRARDLTHLTRKDLSARLDAKSEEYRQISARVTAQKEILNSVAVKDDGIKELTDKKYAAKRAAGAKRKEIKDTRDAFYAAKKAYYEWSKGERERKDAEFLSKVLSNQKYQESRLKEEQAAAGGEEEEEEDTGHPWAAEIDECARLITYLTKLSGTSTAVAPPPVPEAGASKGKKKGLRDDGDFDFLSGALDSRKPKVKAAKPKTITHTFETISLFGKLGLQAPNDVSVFPQLITALEAKKAEYATMPAPPKAPKAAKAEAAPSFTVRRTAVNTPYGSGEVVTVRDDGVLVVKMDKFEALAYLQQSQVKLVPRPRTGPPKPRA